MTTPIGRLESVLAAIPARIIACSGGVDSLLLATIAHRCAPGSTTVAHAVTPAVPGAATGRTIAVAEAEGWNLELVRTDEFDDERYLANPADRCYYCKSHLYETLDGLARRLGDRLGYALLSGANRDDLDDYRPGLTAAAERGVRHPFVEADIGKDDIRALAASWDLDFAQLPASPCLASRLYTGTRVTPARLQAVDAGEELIRRIAGVSVVRCRLRDSDVAVEVLEHDRSAVTADLLVQVERAMRAIEPSIGRAQLDDRPYRTGQAVLRIA